MEEDFLDIGFVNTDILSDFQDAKQTEEEKNDPEPPKNETQEVENNKGNEELNNSNKETGANPSETSEGSPNLSSSIALSLVDEGLLQTLDNDRIKGITNAEELIEAFREDLHNQLDERQKRIDNALNYGVEPTRIQQYEQWITTLDGITDEIISAETEAGENYRKSLIMQNFINKGFQEDEAREMVERSVESGKDVDDAKKALESCKKFFRSAYDKEISDAKKQYDKRVEDQRKQMNKIENAIMNDDEFYDQFEINKTTRKKIFDSVAKPTFDDNGQKITALQKYMKDNPVDSYKILGTLFVLTEGFTKFDNIMKGKVKKEVRKSMQNLERVLNQTKVTDGSFNYQSGIGTDNPNFKLLDFDF